MTAVAHLCHGGHPALKPSCASMVPAAERLGLIEMLALCDKEVRLGLQFGHSISKRFAVTVLSDHTTGLGWAQEHKIDVALKESVSEPRRINQTV